MNNEYPVINFDTLVAIKVRFNCNLQIVSNEVSKKEKTIAWHLNCAEYKKHKEWHSFAAILTLVNMTNLYNIS